VTARPSRRPRRRSRRPCRPIDAPRGRALADAGARPQFAAETRGRSIDARRSALPTLWSGHAGVGGCDAERAGARDQVPGTMTKIGCLALASQAHPARRPAPRSARVYDNGTFGTNKIMGSASRATARSSTNQLWVGSGDAGWQSGVRPDPASPSGYPPRGGRGGERRTTEAARGGSGDAGAGRRRGNRGSETQGCAAPHHRFRPTAGPRPATGEGRDTCPSRRGGGGGREPATPNSRECRG
jgi:hypothetical protein